MCYFLLVSSDQVWQLLATGTWLKQRVKKPELLCGCLATCYFCVTTAIMLMQLHRAAATNHSPKRCRVRVMSEAVQQTITLLNSSLSAGVHPWIMTQNFPPQASSSLSTMRLAQLCFAPSKGNAVLEAGGLIGQNWLRFYDLILPFFSLSVSWCEVLHLWFKRSSWLMTSALTVSFCFVVAGERYG